MFGEFGEKAKDALNPLSGFYTNGSLRQTMLEVMFSGATAQRLIAEERAKFEAERAQGINHLIGGVSLRAVQREPKSAGE